MELGALHTSPNVAPAEPRAWTGDAGNFQGVLLAQTVNTELAQATTQQNGTQVVTTGPEGTSSALVSAPDGSLWIQFNLFDSTYNRAIPRNNAWNRFWDAANPLPELLGTGNANNGANPLVADQQWQAPAYFLRQAGLEMQPDGTVLIPATRDGARLLAVMNYATISFGAGHYGQLDIDRLFMDLPVIPELKDTYRDTARQITGAQAYSAGQTIVTGLAAAAPRLTRPTPTTIVNSNTGQRLVTTSNPRTGGVLGALYDRNGVPLASQTTVGRDFTQTVTGTPNGGNVTPNVNPGALMRATPQTTVNPGAVVARLTVAGTPIVIRSETAGGAPNFTAIYGGLRVSLPGATSIEQARQQVRNLASQGNLPGVDASGPVVTDSRLTLRSGESTYQFTIRNTQENGQSTYTVHYRIGGRGWDFRLDGASTLSEASQQVTQALNNGSLPGISSYTRSRLTLTADGKSYHLIIHNVQIGNQPNYWVSYRINGEDHAYSLPGVRTLSEASQQVNREFNNGNLPGLTRPQPQQQPQPTGSVGAMSANDEPQPSLTPYEIASATDLTQRYDSLEEARAHAETRPETEIFKYTDHPNSPEGDDAVYFHGGQEARPGVTASMTGAAEPPGAPIEFIARNSVFHPNKDAFNQAMNEWTGIVSSSLASDNPEDRSLRNILAQIKPSARNLARELFLQPNIRRDYGHERMEGARNTILNYSIFQENIPLTLEMIQRDWDNVFLLGGEKPSFPAEELNAHLQAGDPEATRLVYAWTIDTAQGQLPTAFITIEPKNPSILNNPYPFTMTTFYASNPQSVAAIKDALSARWNEIQSIPAGDPRAVEAIADFMYDYYKLYWHWSGDGEIGTALIAGYLESKDFPIERMTPGLDVSGQSFQTTRQEYIDNFVNGRYFELRNPPGDTRPDIRGQSPAPDIRSETTPPDITASLVGGIQSVSGQDPVGIAAYVLGMAPEQRQAFMESQLGNEAKVILREATEFAGAPYRTNMGITPEQHTTLSNNLTLLRDAWSALSPVASVPGDVNSNPSAARTLTVAQTREIMRADGLDEKSIENYINQSNGLIFYWPNDQIAGLPREFYSDNLPSNDPRTVAGEDRTAFENALTGTLYPLPEGGFLVSPRLPSNTQLFVFGDIHGTSNLYNAIQQTAERLTSQGPGEAGGDLRTIIASIGDLGNKGPDTAFVAEDLLARYQRYSNEPNTDFLIFSGNHEDPATYGMLLDANADVTNAHVRFQIHDILKKGGYLTLQSFERRAVERGEQGFNVDITTAPDPNQEGSLRYYEQLQMDIARIVPQDYRDLALNLPLGMAIGDFFVSHGGGDPSQPRFQLNYDFSFAELSPEQDFRWHRLPNEVAGDEGNFFFDLREPVYPVFGHTMNIRPGGTPLGFDLDASAFRAWQMTGLYIPPNGQGEAQVVLARQSDGLGRDVEVRVVSISQAITEGLIDTRFNRDNLVPNREEKTDQPLIRDSMNQLPPTPPD